MSNIYIQEPPTYGKVLMVTSVGDIDIELWSKEAPKACRNFIQLCMEGNYNGTIFHRVVKGFIVQGGDPTGTGTGGESVYGEPFKDEFHTRLRFNRRGLVAMANSGKDDNGSQFFFTLAPCPELQNKHTIFAKVTGETLYNMLKLEDGLIDDDERPVYPQKIIKTEILYNPFSDIVPRSLPTVVEKKVEKKKEKTGVKNFKLLSFGDEAEEDEEETLEINKNFAGRSKSTHDLLDDPKLSAEPAVDKIERNSDDESSLSGDEEHKSNEGNQGYSKEKLENIKNKLKRFHSDSKNNIRENNEEGDETESEISKIGDEHKKRKMEEIKKEIRDLKKNYQKERREKETAVDASKTIQKEDEAKDILREYNKDLEKYKIKMQEIPKKGSSREAFTLSLLAKFQKTLTAAKEKNADECSEDVKDQEEEDDDESAWMTHKLEFATSTPVLAKDASTKDDDWFDITDPRNAINKRRRETSKNILNSKEKRTF